MITFTSLGNSIDIRGRTPERKRYSKKEEYRPYFYIQDNDGKYLSIFGDKLKRITVGHPSMVSSKRDGYSQTFEADVIYTTRYTVDNFKDIPYEPYRVCFLDIEVDDSDGFPSANKDRILSIATYDNYNEKFYVFVLNHDVNNTIKRTEFEGKQVSIHYYQTEKELLDAFVSFINDFDFDIILGWNAEQFDYPYIVNRLKVLSISPEILSPYEEMDKHTKMPRGRNWLDLMWMYRKVSTHELESMRLDYIANEELGRGKIERGKCIDLWRDDFEQFIRYNVNDVYLMVAIEAKKGILSYYDTVRRFAFCSWSDVQHNSRVLDCYFLKKAKEMGIVLPTGIKREEMNPIEGARVIEPMAGIHEWVAVGDVRSLYPTAILAGNISPETIINPCLNEVDYVTIGPTMFRTDVRGFIPTVVEDLWELRQQFKGEMKKYPMGSSEYDKWDTIQTVCKFLLNSIYGVMLAPHFRLYNREMGAAVTFFGRKANEWMEQRIKELGYAVIAGDTDSLFFKLNGKDENEAQKAIDYVNDSMKEFCIQNFGSDKYNRMYVEFEKIYSKLLLMNEKKRYAGLISFKDGDWVEPFLEVKGFESKRSDTPSMFRKLQKEIFTDILTGKGNEYILSKLKNIRMKILEGKYLPEDIAIPKGMSKPVDEYTKSIPAHVAGALYLNRYLGGNIKREKVKYLYVNSSPAGLPETHVISFVEKCPTGFDINYERMAQALINDKFSSILTIVGIDPDFLSMNGKQTTMEAWF